MLPFNVVKIAVAVPQFKLAHIPGHHVGPFFIATTSNAITFSPLLIEPGEMQHRSRARQSSFAPFGS